MQRHLARTRESISADPAQKLGKLIACADFSLLIHGSESLIRKESRGASRLDHQQKKRISDRP